MLCFVVGLFCLVVGLCCFVVGLFCFMISREEPEGETREEEGLFQAKAVDEVDAERHREEEEEK